MKPIYEMAFKEFADGAKTSAGMNRWPQLGAAHDVVFYSVYMSGEIMDSLPASVREHEYRDVVLHALTEKLGLDPLSMRDNLKVAEVLAMRHAYMSAVLEASLAFQLSPEVQAEYELLSNQMSHPVIRRAIEDQIILSSLLKPVLASAERALGQQINEQDAHGVSRGAIILQNTEFSVQDIGGGRVVAHENRRLESVPSVGNDVTVTYYRGKGQVIENIQALGFGQVFVDPESGDMALQLANANGVVEHVVMFSSMVMVAEFATEHGLGKDFVRNAMEAREAKPKIVAARARREIVGDPYIDQVTQSLAIDYYEGAVRYTAVFGNTEEFHEHAKNLGASNRVIEKAKDVFAKSATNVERLDQVSWSEAVEFAQSRGESLKRADVDKGQYSGPVIGATALHVVQDLGRSAVVIHDKRDLDKVPMVGEKMSVAYNAGRGKVTVREFSKERSVSRC